MTEHMNSNLNSDEPKKPDFLSCIAALVGIGLLLSTTALVSIKLESNRIKNELANIKGGQNLIPILIEIVRPRGLAKFLTNDDKVKALSELTAIETSLNKKDYLTASQKLSNLSDATTLVHKIENISEKEDEIIALSKEKEEKQNELNIVKSDFNSLSNDAAAFFGLDPEKNLNLEISFYQTGILQGIPVLKAIPDDIPDVQKFSEIINQSGGKIEIENTENPAEIFQQKLDELKDRAFNISLSYASLDEKLQELEEFRTSKESKNKKELAEITQFLNELALNLVKN